MQPFYVLLLKSCLHTVQRNGIPWKMSVEQPQTVRLCQLLPFPSVMPPNLRNHVHAAVLAAVLAASQLQKCWIKLQSRRPIPENRVGRRNGKFPMCLNWTSRRQPGKKISKLGLLIWTSRNGKLKLRSKIGRWVRKDMNAQECVGEAF